MATLHAQSPLNFIPVTPCRVADTRSANGPFGGPELTAGATRSFVIPNSACNIPSNAAAYSLNVTVVPAGILGFLAIWPSGQSQPIVSTLNSDGRVKANAAIVPAGTNGGVAVYVSQTSHVILDINGYFVSGNNSALDFYPLTPCRIADTRYATGPFGGPYLSAAVARSFSVLASACSIPASAQAYSLNFTAIPHQPIGFLATWPAGRSQPVVSTLNAPTSAVTANAAIVPAGTGGAIEVYSSSDSDVAIDVNGYFAPPATGGLSLYNVTPCRALDTRQNNGSPFQGTITSNVSASACQVPASAGALVLNATVVPSAGPSGLGYLSLWPTGTGQPLVSTLNAFDGAVTSNMAIVPATNGSVNTFATNPTQLILDISGYFASNTSSSGSTGTFSATGPMITNRVYHTATLLQNGTVLLTGGYNLSAQTTLPSAEIYNPATGTFSATGSMITARAQHTATLLPNGTVLIAGGFGSDGSPLASAEIYNPATGTFSATGAMFGYEFTATLLPNGTVLGTGSGGGITEIFNPATGTFKLTGDVLVPYLENNMATLLANGTVLVAGGDNSNLGNVYASAEIYNYAAGTFSATGSMITARTIATSTLLANGTVLVAGGNVPFALGGTGTTLASAEIYNPATGVFISTGSMTAPRQEDTATLLPNGTVLVVGGGAPSTGTILASTEIYNPATGTFSANGLMTTPRADHTATLLPNGTVLLAGGNTRGAGAELFQP